MDKIEKYLSQEAIRAKPEISERELAFLWNMNPGTLRWWRSVKRGPSYNKRGKKVTYSMVDIDGYEKTRKITLTY